MIRACICTFFVAVSAAAQSPSAQTFDPGMPAGVPRVSGSVMEPFALRYIDTVPGTGPAALPGKQYVVLYDGYLRDGTKFSSARDQSRPFDFVQGKRQVIAGWEAGFEGMRVGGKRRIFIPYQMAYGEKGRGAIPPKAELIFDVELLAVKDVPDVTPASEVLLSLSDTAGKVIRLAEAVPEEKYAWKPAAGVRSFRQVFMHIALANRLLLGLAMDAPSKEALESMIAQNDAAEKQEWSKARVLQELRDSFAKAHDTITAQGATLGRNASLFDTATTRRGILIALDVHAAEHLGQAIAYARVNGITPPWAGN